MANDKIEIEISLKNAQKTVDSLKKIKAGVTATGTEAAKAEKKTKKSMSGIGKSIINLKTLNLFVFFISSLHL